MRNKLANERTLLAWIRTALAIVALGFLLMELGYKLWLVAVAVSAFTTLLGAHRYRCNAADLKDTP